MALEWLPRDDAARTLNVGVDVLQQWIDDGRAPTRTQDGHIQVLIEYSDDDEPPESPDTPETPDTSDTPDAAAPAAAADASATPGNGHRAQSPGESPAHHLHEHVDSRGEPADHAGRIDLIDNRHQLQMAGGMVAAWQHVAESADHELSRSRRIGALAWSVVATLSVLGGVGLWYSAHAVTDARAQVTLGEHDQQRMTEKSAGDAQRIAELTTQRDQLRQDLSEAQARLTASVEKAALAAGQVDKLLEQNRLLSDANRAQTDAHAKVIAAFQTATDTQRRRIDALEKDLASANQSLAETRKSLADSQKQLADALTKLRDADKQAASHQLQVKVQAEAIEQATRQREELQSQLDAQLRKNADAAAELAQLQKQVAALQTAIDKAKAEKGDPPAQTKTPAQPPPAQAQAKSD